MIVGIRVAGFANPIGCGVAAARIIYGELSDAIDIGLKTYCGDVILGRDIITDCSPVTTDTLDVRRGRIVAGFTDVYEMLGSKTA